MSERVYNCPEEVSIYNDIDGRAMVRIDDGYDGCCIMSPEEFRMLAANYLKWYISEYN